MSLTRGPGAARKDGPNSTPEAFAEVIRNGAGPLINVNNRSSDIMALNGNGENGALAIKLKEVFAPLIYNGITGPSNGLDVAKYSQNLDLNKPYKNRVVPVFQDFVTAQIINGSNNFLLDIVSPPWETPEMNFTVNRTEFNAITFNNIAEFGIPDQQTKFSYGWTDSTKRFALSTTISRDLALDLNFGAQVWIEELNQFVSNANLTINTNIILSVVQIGYTNQVQNKSLNIKVDQSKLYLEESEDMLMMALQPARVLGRLNNLVKKIPGLNMLIIPQGGEQYTNELTGESLSMLSQKLITDIENDRVLVEFADSGYSSNKTIRVAGRQVNIMEFTPFVINTLSEITVDPLRTNVTVCQYFPPNPKVTFDGPTNSTDPSILDRFVFYQTKTMGRDERISHRTMLANANYWDPKDKGRVSRTNEEFARYLTQRVKTSKEHIPYDWNPLYGNNHGDINREVSDANKPIMSDVSGKTDLDSMHSWRQYFCGVLYRPDINAFVIPELIGDFHNFNIPNEWVHKAAKLAVLKGKELNADIDLDVYFARFKRFAKAMKSAPIQDAYIEGLINKNMVRMLNPDRDGTSSYRTATTPEYKTDSKRFPGISRIDEWIPNRMGGLDLPDRTGLMTSPYPAGFANGVGIIILAAEVLNPKSLWKEAGEEADALVTFAKFLLKFIQDSIGKTGYTNKKRTSPWFHKESALTVLLDHLIRAEGPLFLGIPAAATISENLVVNASLPVSVLGNTADSFLKKTQADTIAAIKTLTGDTDEAVVPVSTIARAYSCVSTEAYEKIGDLLSRMRTVGDLDGGDQKFVNDFTLTLNSMAEYIVKFANYGQKLSTNKIQASSIILEGFVDKVNDRIIAAEASGLKPDNLDADDGHAKLVAMKRTIIREARNFEANFKSSDSMKAFFEELRKQTEKGKAPVSAPLVTFADELYAYEKFNTTRRITATRGEVGAGGAAGVPKPSGFEGDFSVAPLKMLRAPITSSKAFVDYIATKENPYVLIADPDTFYEFPQDVRKTYESTQSKGRRMNRKLRGEKTGLTSLSKNSQILSQVYSTGNGGLVSSYDNMDEEYDGLFTSLRTQKSKKSLDINQLLDLGARYDDDNDMNDYQSFIDKSRKKVSPLRNPQDKTGEVHYESLLSQAYVGPWRLRIKYRNDEITSAAEAFMFMNILESKNNLKTPTNIAKFGGQIFEVMLTRPFTELTTHAMVAMEAGARTMNTTIGHSSVTVTKESRGLFHINCDFIMGILRINPDNIALIFHAFPVAFIGGKKVDFMTNFDNFELANPAKESIIAFLLPVSERITASPMHLRNKETYIRPGIDDAVWERKCSAFGTYYDWLLREHNPSSVDSNQTQRSNYSISMPVSHVANLGPTSYIDHYTLKKEDVEGVGPLGSRRMNMEGCQETYEGRSVKFPDLAQRYFYQNSS